MVAVVPSCGDRDSIFSSLNRDLGLISDWCSGLYMVLNAAKSKSLIVLQSPTLLPAFSGLRLANSVVLESMKLYILGVTFDSKLTFALTFVLLLQLPLRSWES